MNLKKEEKDKIDELKDKIKDMDAKDAQIIVLQSIADSLIILAHKIGRKFL